MENSKSAKRGIKGQAIFELVAILLVIVFVNIIGSFFFTRIDFTKEKRYSLAPASKEIANNLDDIVFIRVYLEGDFPAGFKRLRNATKELLDEFRAYGGSNIQYEFINPLDGKSEAQQRDIVQQLASAGIQPTSLQVKTDGGSEQKIIFPGAIINFRGKEIPVQLLQQQVGKPAEETLNASTQGLEYAFANAFKKLTTKRATKIAFLEGHGELDSLQTRDLTLSLRQFYRTDRVDLGSIDPSKLKEAVDLLNTYNLLIVAKPLTAFEETEKFLIDQFVMHGGKVIWMVDALAISMDSLNKDGNSTAVTMDLNLDDMLFKYGVRINSSLVQDLNCSGIPLTVGKQTELFPWLYFPLMMPTGDHPIVKNVDGVLGKFVNTLDYIDVGGVKKTTILHTSPYSKVLYAPVRVSLNTVSIEPNPDQFKVSKAPVGVLLEGEFPSLFENRLIPNQQVTYEPKFKSVPTKQIVIADGDFIENYVSSRDGSFFPLGYDRFTRQTYANMTYISNCIDYLTDETGLMSVRAKEIKLRLLNKAKVAAEKTTWQIINMIVPVVLVLLFGLFYTIRRKKKYAV